MKIRLRARNAAFSLIETAMGMAVIGLGMATLFSGIGFGFFTMKMSRENLRATQVMLEKAETLRLYSWSQITNSSYIQTNFTARYDPRGTTGNQGVTYSGTVTIERPSLTTDYNDDMRLVTVRVNWKSGELQRTRNFRTLVSRYGMQDYIY